MLRCGAAFVKWGFAVALVALASMTLAALPQSAWAEASPGPEAKAGPSGLPDGRVYEQASPQNKPGSEAGAPTGETPPFVQAGTDGDEVAYYNSGPIGETPTGFDYFSVSRRGSGGWSTHGALPRGLGSQEFFSTNPETGLGFSFDMGATLYGAQDDFLVEQEADPALPVHLYRYSEDGSLQWIGAPAIADPISLTNSTYEDGELAGASPDFETVYFGFEGTLTPVDDEPNPALGDKSRSEVVAVLKAEGRSSGDDGFYEWNEGRLESAGVLPNGHLDPDGAAPAATLSQSSTISAELFDNQVSEDGKIAFFVSPDPGSGSARPVEIYAHETASDGTQHTVLVSRDLLLPEVEGLPVGAPDGAVPGNGGKSEGRRVAETGSAYIYASSDGSRVFFESTDQLTASAPSEGKVMEYEFDIQTNTLTYLPGVADLEGGTVHVLGAARDGSDFVFLREGELELWNEGTITAIAPISSGSSAIAFTRAAANGSAFVFQTKSPLTEFGFNNGEGSYEQIYRYEVAANTLACVSCPPGGTTPTGSATISHDFPSGNLANTFFYMTGNRGISEDGDRVFFDTLSALLPQDTNGVRDVYEWEEGTLSLISTGVSSEESYFGDNSPSGNDVFFATAEGLVPGDTDEGYDIYDARIPRPGDQLPPSAVPCEGSVCQGPPSVPQLLAPPASETFAGEGNVPQAAPPGHSAPKSLTRAQKLARAMRACKSRKGRKRKECKRRAHRRYGAHMSAKAGERTIADNGRGA
jgi:hypothetical protein